jgi:hypothetical protein
VSKPPARDRLKIESKGGAAMINMAESQERREILAGIIQSVLGWLHKLAPAEEIDRLGKEEIDRIARDMGVNEYELRTLARTPAGATVLLNRRLATLHLDSEHTGRIQPAVLRDLQVHCAMCAAKKRCAGDLASGVLDSTWQDYCPNAHTLRDLVATEPAPNTIEDLIIYLNTVGDPARPRKSDSGDRSRLH